MRRPVSHRRAALAVLALLMVAGCEQGDVGSLPPPPTFQSTTTTTEPDFSAVGLPEVPGRAPTTTVPFFGGQANLTGVVVGPDGAAALGAVVRVDRLVGDDEATAMVPTQSDGTWIAGQVLGGRYRVRAWRAPDLAMVEAEIFFLGGSEEKQLTLQLRRFDGVEVSSTIAPDPPIVAQPANVVVLVTTASVDDQGVVRATPRPGVRVDLIGTAAWRVESGSRSSVTDSSGQARWRVRCDRSGDQPLSVIVDSSDTYPVETGPCTAPEPSTTTTAGVTTTSSRP